jgi:hypothetical protein
MLLQVAIVTGAVISANDIPRDIEPRLTPVPGGNVILGAYRLHSVLPDGMGESLDYQVGLREAGTHCAVLTPLVWDPSVLTPPQILCNRGRELSQVRLS